MSDTASQAELDAARLLLARMGISPGDLIEAATKRPQAPTFADYVPIVSAAVSDGTRRAYGSYWKRVLEQWGRGDSMNPPHRRSSSLRSTSRRTWSLGEMHEAVEARQST